MAEVARSSARGPRSAFRRSLILGCLLFSSIAWALHGPPVEPIAYFGGWLLAKKFGQLERLESERDVEVLAVGSSHVDTGFDAAEFERATGLVAYNFGLGGVDLYLQSVYLRDVLLPMVEPRVLFWELPDVPYLVRPMTKQYREAPALSAASGLWGHRRVELESALPHQHKRRLPEWYHLFHDPPEAEVDEHGHSSLTGTIGGTAPRARAVTDEEERDYATEDERLARAVEALDAFERTLDLALERGITVYLLMTPFHASAFEPGAPYRERVLTGTVQAFRQRLEVVLAAREAQLVNLRHHADITDDDELFADAEHLNAKGALALTEILAEVQQGRAIPERWARVMSPAELRALDAERGAPGTRRR